MNPAAFLYPHLRSGLEGLQTDMELHVRTEMEELQQEEQLKQKLWAMNERDAAAAAAELERELQLKQRCKVMLEREAALSAAESAAEAAEEAYQQRAMRELNSCSAPLHAPATVGFGADGQSHHQSAFLPTARTLAGVPATQPPLLRQTDSTDSVCSFSSIPSIHSIPSIRSMRMSSRNDYALDPQTQTCDGLANEDADFTPSPSSAAATASVEDFSWVYGLPAGVAQYNCMAAINAVDRTRGLEFQPPVGIRMSAPATGHTAPAAAAMGPMQPTNTQMFDFERISGSSQSSSVAASMSAAAGTLKLQQQRKQQQQHLNHHHHQWQQQQQQQQQQYHHQQPHLAHHHSKHTSLSPPHNPAHTDYLVDVQSDITRHLWNT
jgi:hypothetical protein